MRTSQYPFAIIAALAVSAAPALPAETLAYRAEAGRVTEYRVTTKARGQQVSLGERRPINVEAEYEVREEVLSTDPEGNARLRVTGRTVSVKDLTRAFGGPRLDLPPVELRLSPRGEILGAGAITPEGAPGMRENATAALLAQSLPVIMPSGPVEAGMKWEWVKGEATQTNHLVETTGENPRVARIASSARAPVVFEERSEALGMTAHLTGLETQVSTLDLALDSGVTLRHKGNLVMETKTKVRMESAEGPRTFQIEMHLRVEFDSRLVKLDGKPV